MHLGARQGRLLPDLGRRRRLAEERRSRLDAPRQHEEECRLLADVVDQVTDDDGVGRDEEPGHRHRARGYVHGVTGPDDLVGHGGGARDLRHLGCQLGRRRCTENHADEARHLTVPAEQRLGRRRARRHSAPRVRACPEVARGGADRSGSELPAAGLGVRARAAQDRGDDDQDDRDELHGDRRGVAVAATSMSKLSPPNRPRRVKFTVPRTTTVTDSSVARTSAPRRSDWSS